jgi:cell division protein ZapE
VNKQIIVSSYSMSGPVSRELGRLVSIGNFRTDPIQTRAAGILDEFSRILANHSSAKTFCALPARFDMRVFGNPSTNQVSENHDEVSQYTQSLADENERLLARQMGKPVVSSPRPVIAENPPSPPAPSPPTIPPITSVGPSVYLFGSVGRGKTVLMDSLFQTLPPRSGRRRLHFFELMRDIHFGMRSSVSITALANDWADKVDCLCIDEVSLSDVQDASIFPKFLEIILKRHVAVIMTSNQHPQDLYINGLNRHVFLPPLLRVLQQSKLVSLGDGVDYRESGTGGKWRWSKLTDSTTTTTLDYVSIPLSPTRTGKLARVAHGLLLVNVNELIDCELSDTDFLTIAKYLNENKLGIRVEIASPFVPGDILTRARRFAKLVETLYDRQCAVEWISAVATPDELFSNFNSTTSATLKEEGLLGESVNAVATPLASSAVDEAVRGIARCVSRLREARVDAS